MDLDLIDVTTSSISPFSQCGPDRDSRRDVFFNRLANRRFPAGAFIRPEEEPGATMAHVPEKFHQPSRKVHPLCEDSVRNPG
jgi:hypothetical protein